MAWCSALLLRVKESQREGERARVSERGGFASLISPCWPNQPGQHLHAAATRRAWPGTVGHDGQLIQID